MGVYNAPFGSENGGSNPPRPIVNRFVLAVLFFGAPLAAQQTPLDAFRGNIAAIHSRNRTAYLSHYLHTPALARVGPDGLRTGYDWFAPVAGRSWPDTLVATAVSL